MDKGDARRLILGLAQQQRHQRIRSDVYFVLCGILFNVLYLISVRTLLNRAMQVRCYYCTHSTDESLREVSIHCTLWLFYKKIGGVQRLSKFGSVYCHLFKINLVLHPQYLKLKDIINLLFVIGGKIIHSQVLPVVFQISYDWFWETHLNSAVVTPLCDRPGILWKRYVKRGPLFCLLCRGQGSMSVGQW